MSESEEAYEKTRPYRERVKGFGELFKPGPDGRIDQGGRRFVTFGLEYSIGAIYREMRRIVGISVDTIIYRAGIQGGFDASKNILEGPLAKMWPDRLEMARTWAGGIGYICGWGILLIEQEDDNLLVKSYNGWEAESYINALGKTDKPICHFTRGFIAGAVGSIWFRTGQVFGEETKCIAKGDPYCEFVITRDSDI